MTQSSDHEITTLLRAWGDGDQSAYEKLVPLIHSELHKRAGYLLRRERPGHLLQTTALVNEIHVRLIKWQNVRWEDRKNFYGVASLLMRRVLVDYAKHYPEIRGAIFKLDIEDATEQPNERGTDLVALDDALESLAKFDARAARLVELRFFGGQTVNEAAEILRISPRQAYKDWELAKTWLYRELSRDTVDE